MELQTELLARVLRKWSAMPEPNPRQGLTLRPKDGSGAQSVAPIQPDHPAMNSILTVATLAARLDL
jgi:hypothetical protein